ncbi:MAG: hypothetical protein NT038_08885 [Euryarchaeota archaeon]|nr:hypothetical protein [Euryarchaeota archaeon]
MSEKQIFIIGIIFFVVMVCFSGCTNNQPSNNEDQNKNDEKSGDQYLWSTMTQGPYHDKISFATSTDLFNWTDSQQMLAEHASVPGAVVKTDVIYVYFVDVSEDGKPEQLGLIRSENNGSNWSEKQIVSFEGIGDKVPVDPAPFLLSDGRIRLYYYDINEFRVSSGPSGTNKIYSAVSTDGVRFIQEDGVRFEKQGIFDPAVINVNNVWRMYVGDIEKNMVISAVSQDGLTFTEEGTAYQGGAVPFVFFKDNIYYLYTAGIDILVSSTGSTFSKTIYSFRSQLGQITADPSVVLLGDGRYMMLYKTK